MAEVDEASEVKDVVLKDRHMEMIRFMWKNAHYVFGDDGVSKILSRIGSVLSSDFGGGEAAYYEESVRQLSTLLLQSRRDVHTSNLKIALHDLLSHGDVGTVISVACEEIKAALGDGVEAVSFDVLFQMEGQRVNENLNPADPGFAEKLAMLIATASSGSDQ